MGVVFFGPFSLHTVSVNIKGVCFHKQGKETIIGVETGGSLSPCFRLSWHHKTSLAIPGENQRVAHAAVSYPLTHSKLHAHSSG